MNQKQKIIIFALQFLHSNLGDSEVLEMMSEALGASMPKDPEAVIFQILSELDCEDELNTKFARFINDIDRELQAQTGNPHLTHRDFPEVDFNFEFQIGSTVAETVSELLLQHQQEV